MTMVCNIADCTEPRVLPAARCREHRNEYMREYHRKDPSRQRRQTLRRKYGLTPEAYDAMHERQEGLCAICKGPEVAMHSKSRQVKRLAIDHNHDTDAIRGLLCQNCNTLVGVCGEDIDVLRAAIAYLDHYRCL